MNSSKLDCYFRSADLTGCSMSKLKFTTGKGLASLLGRSSKQRTQGIIAILSFYRSGWSTTPSTTIGEIFTYSQFKQPCLISLPSKNCLTSPVPRCLEVGSYRQSEGHRCEDFRSRKVNAQTSIRSDSVTKELLGDDENSFFRLNRVLMIDDTANVSCPKCGNGTIKRSIFNECKEERLGFLGSRLRQRFFVALMAASLMVTIPSVVINNGFVEVTSNSANAQPMGQIRQAAMFLEKFAGEKSVGKILDKVMTVISGQTMVTPETIEELKAIIEGEEDIHDWKTEIVNNIETWWSIAFDLVKHFDPLALLESAGTGFQGLVEAGAERFAAFELSTLVALGERWLLWGPIIVLPMYWQMSRSSKNSEEENSRNISPGDVELTQEALAKAQRVRRELERIELKGQLLEAVNSLGKMALQSLQGEENLKRRKIEDVMERLQQLNPLNYTLLNDVGSTSAALSQNDSFLQVQPIPEVDGDWYLIYVSQPEDQNQQQQLPLFPALDFPGVELNNMWQRVWHKTMRGSALNNQEDITNQMLAKNTAELRLGPLGVMQLSVQGTWENLNGGRSALVSFNTIYVRPMEFFGNQIREDLPSLEIPIPRTLQTRGEWEITYLDDSMRINRGRRGQFFLFQKM